MYITTKELFELAELYWNTSLGALPPDAQEDAEEWADLSPIEQGSEAEGVKAIIEELQRRGWEPPKYDLGGWTIPAEFHFPKPYWPIPDSAPKPRTWDQFEDVPIGVIVESENANDRLHYRRDEGRDFQVNAKSNNLDPSGWMSGNGVDTTGPFVAVAE